MKEETAEKFNKQPALIYRCADNGEEVVIKHSRYPHRVFKLVAIDIEDHQESEAKNERQRR